MKYSQYKRLPNANIKWMVCYLLLSLSLLQGYSSGYYIHKPQRGRYVGEQVSFLKDNARLSWELWRHGLDESQKQQIYDLEADERHKLKLNTSFPSYPLERLFLTTKKGKETIVQCPDDLAGYVDIRTPEQALNFVRLFSTIETYYRFPEYRYLELFSSKAGKSEGIVSLEHFEALGLIEAQVEEKNGKFYILRSVAIIQEHPKSYFYGPGKVAFVAIISEVVEPNGSYSVFMLSKASIPKEIADDFVNLPMIY